MKRFPFKNYKTLKTCESYEYAIDLTDDPYYGKINSSNEKYGISEQAKKVIKLFLLVYSPSTLLTRMKGLLYLFFL